MHRAFTTDGSTTFRERYSFLVAPRAGIPLPGEPRTRQYEGVRLAVGVNKKQRKPFDPLYQMKKEQLTQVSAPSEFSLC